MLFVNFYQTKKIRFMNSLAGRCIFSVALLLSVSFCPMFNSLALARDRTGTAFAVGEGYHLVTAAHVVSDKPCVFVGQAELGQPERAQANQITWRAASTLAVDEEADIAILRVASPLPPLMLSDWKRVGIGADIVVLGYPRPEILGLGLKAAAGIVSGEVADVRSRHLFQVNVAVMPGNSGSPVISKDGRVIGLARGRLRNASALADASVSFAISGDTLADFLAANGVEVDVEVSPQSHERTVIYETSAASILFVYAGSRRAFKKRFGLSSPPDCSRDHSSNR